MTLSILPFYILPLKALHSLPFRLSNLLSDTGWLSLVLKEITSHNASWRLQYKVASRPA